MAGDGRGYVHICHDNQISQLKHMSFPEGIVVLSTEEGVVLSTEEGCGPVYVKRSW